MESPQNRILLILLKSLLDQGLIPIKMYAAAVNIINSTFDFPKFFQYPLICNEEEKHGCS